MSNFSWHSEEDEWDAGDDIEIGRNTDDGDQARRWAMVRIGILLIGFVVGCVWLFQRVTDVDTDIEGQVALTHSLVNLASRTGDVELMETAMSGLDPSWVEIQRSLAQNGGRFDRQRFGFGPSTPSSSRVELAYDLRSAEVTTVVDHLDVSGNTIQLEHVSVYRLGRNRWLAAPPLPEYWGESSEYTTANGRVIVFYPERDAIVAKRLADDLGVLVEQWCAPERAALNCARLFPLQIRFDTDEVKLLENDLADSVELISTGGFWVVPTPTLFGMPTGEASYQSVKQIFAAQLLRGIVIELLDYECCRPPDSILTALINKELAISEPSNGLSAYFQSPADLQLHRQSDITAGLFEIDSEQAALLINFAVDNYQQDPLSVLARVLHQPLNWSGQLFPAEAGDSIQIQSELVRFAFKQAPPELVDAAVIDTSQSILGVCRSSDGMYAAMRFMPNAQQWRPLSGQDAATILTAAVLADDQTVLWFDGSGLGVNDLGRFELGFGDGRQSQPLFEGAFEQAIIYNAASSTEQWVDFVVARPGESITLSVDAQACESGLCELQTLRNRVSWSPDLQHYLKVETINEQTNVFLFTADHQLVANRPILRPIFEPYWIDNNRFFLLKPISEIEDPIPLWTLEAFASGTTPNSSELMLDMRAIVAQDGIVSGRWRVTELFPLFDQPNFVVIHMSNDISNYTLIVKYDLAQNEVGAYRVFAGVGRTQISPQSSWLLWQSIFYNQEILIDVDTLDIVINVRSELSNFGPTWQTFGGARHIDWSADEQYLAVFQPRFLSLYDAVADVYVHLPYPHGNDMCSGGGWMD